MSSGYRLTFSVNQCTASVLVPKAGNGQDLGPDGTAPSSAARFHPIGGGPGGIAPLLVIGEAIVRALWHYLGAELARDSVHRSGGGHALTHPAAGEMATITDSGP